MKSKVNPKIGITYPELGNKIKELRHSKHLTKLELADAMKTSVIYIDQIEHCKRSITFKTLEHFSEVLNQPLLIFEPYVKKDNK